MFMRILLLLLLTLAIVGCGGKEEVKKNEGQIVSTPPTSAPGPGGTIQDGGAKEVSPPPIPPINE